MNRVRLYVASTIVGIIAGVSIANNARADVLDGSLVGRYEFADSGALLVDTAPGHTVPHDGTNNGVSWSANVDGRLGIAQFTANTVAANGSQYTVAAHPDFNSTVGAITFWMNTAGNASPGNFASILFDRRTAPGGDVITMMDDGRLFVQATAGPGGVTNSFSSATAVNDGTWHHIAYVYNQNAGGPTQIYIDGDLDASQNNTGAWSWPATQQLEFGRSHDGFWKRYDGRLDDVRVYNSSLSGAQIGAIMTENTPMVAAGDLVARYGFDNSAAVLDDTAPSHTADHDGVNNGVLWESEYLGRSGVARFEATPTPSSQFTVAPHSDFNAPAGSIAFWVKSGANVGPGNDGAIIFDRRTSNGDVIVLFNDGKLFVQATDGGLRNSFYSTATINDDEWHHVVYVYDQAADGATQLYVDGVFDSANPNSGAWSWPAGQQLEFGRSHDPYWRSFNGQMDDVRYYNRPLGPDEVFDVYTTPIPEPSTCALAMLLGLGIVVARKMRRRD